MAKTSTLNVSATVLGDGFNTTWNVTQGSNVAQQWTNSSAPEGIPVQLPLTGATNTSVAVPSGATFLVLRGNGAASSTVTVKGVNGDTGVPVDATRPFVWPIPTGATTIVLNSSVTQTLDAMWL